MSEQSDDQSVTGQDLKLDEAFRQLENDKAPEAQVKRSSQALSMLLALVALALAGYSNFILYQQNESEPMTALPAEVAQIESQLQSQGKAYENKLAKIDAARLTVENQHQTELNTIHASIQKLESIAPTTVSNDWVLAEIKYLIRMANQRVLMEQDPDSALALLRSADALLSETQSLTAFSLRQALASDIASLQAMSRLDTEGLYLRFSALLQQSEKLQQRHPVYAIPEVLETPQQDEVDILSRLVNLLTRAGHRIMSLVDFRRDQVEIVPILPPEEQYYLKQNLILKLQMSQRSLLDKNDEIYQQSVQQAIDWIEQYYDPDLPLTMSMLAELKELKKVDVQQQLPDVSASLAAVREFMNSAQPTEAQ